MSWVCLVHSTCIDSMKVVQPAGPGECSRLTMYSQLMPAAFASMLPNQCLPAADAVHLLRSISSDFSRD